jgi:predicted NBD/HSP70 family sugar kinase
VLRKIVLDGETTRAVLAASCGLSAATVTNVVGELMRDGLVRETGLLPSEGGRPMSLLGVVPEGAHVIGVDVGENGVTAELFDLLLNRVDRVFRELATRTVSPERVTSALSDAVAILRKEHPGPAASLAGIGLGVPGIVDVTADGTTTVYAQSLGWDPIVVDQLFRLDDVPVYAENGAKTLATAESWFGAARGTGHAVVVLVGRGLGAGVIAGGRILRGYASSAGEWGHTKVSIGGPACQCGGRGCLEAYVGGEAILRRWGETQDRRNGTRGGVQGTDETRLAHLLRDDAAGDTVAREVLSETVEILGMGLANLVNLFNPKLIVVGGWVGLRLLQARRDELELAIRRHALRHPGEHFRLEACALGEDAVALGAALLPLDHMIEGDIPAPKART